MLDVRFQILEDLLCRGKFVGGLGIGEVGEGVVLLRMLDAESGIGARRGPDAADGRFLLENGNVEPVALEPFRRYESRDTGADDANRLVLFAIHVDGDDSAGGYDAFPAAIAPRSHRRGQCLCR